MVEEEGMRSDSTATQRQWFGGVLVATSKCELKEESNARSEKEDSTAFVLLFFSPLFTHGAI